MATYLIRCAETGREQQARLGKLRNDLARVIAERLPGARIETAPGRVIVEAGEAALDGLAALPGVSSVSPSARVPFDELERAIVELARKHRASASTTIAIRVRRGGEKAGASARERRPDLARRLANAITAATGARIDLTRPDLVQATAPREQLAEVLAALQLSPDPARQFTRCTRCNARLETVEESAVRDRLPEGVRSREQVILHCPGCDQLYWRGSHVDRILAELAP